MTRTLFRSFAVLGITVAGVVGIGGGAASAHPLGNFTTNTATRLTVDTSSVRVQYVVDLAEIPTLTARQSMGDPEVWKVGECAKLLRGVDVRQGSVPLKLSGGAVAMQFRPGQAGLDTLRLECTGTAPLVGSGESFAVADGNFADRVGWREITAAGVSASPSALLTAYPEDAVSSPLHERSAAFTVVPGAAAVSSEPQVAVGRDDRGNDGITQRFQNLVARDTITWPFALGAVLLAMVLGGLHALAPGHGKTIMAAYAVGRRGARKDIAAIGLTVALTHTVGIIGLGALVSATSLASPDRALKWASVASGLLVVAVGIGLLRSRFMARRLLQQTQQEGASEAHDHHEHDHHDHPHDHDHDHDHDHGHSHPHDPRFVVTSHSHGGWSHDHVLPAPGAVVRRRELIAMGLAGGMVPSPSALVVLLAAIALGRIPFGLALVVAYGIGLALTLVVAGLLIVRFERRVRTWTARRTTPTGAAVGAAVAALPFISGLAIAGAGALLVARSLAAL